MKIKLPEPPDIHEDARGYAIWRIHRLLNRLPENHTPLCLICLDDDGPVLHPVMPTDDVIQLCYKAFRQIGPDNVTGIETLHDK